MTTPMNRRDWLIHVIEALHTEIAALKVNDIDALERATQIKWDPLESTCRHASLSIL